MRRVNRRARESVETTMGTLTLEKPVPARQTHLDGSGLDYEDSGDPRENLNKLNTLYDRKLDPKDAASYYEEIEKHQYNKMLIAKEMGYNVSLIAEERAGFTHQEIQDVHDLYAEKMKS